MKDIFIDIERLVVDVPAGASLDGEQLARLTERALVQHFERRRGWAGPRSSFEVAEVSAPPVERDARGAEAQAARELARVVASVLDDGGRR